tara:strand:- start:210 stop:521 length:312 start_codon:yes stop_codon:yes gene_type:complete
MIYLKIIILFKIILLITSCGTIKEGFTNQKKNSSDEFLVEKKSPLVMPPDYKELPIPNQNNKEQKKNENKIQELIQIKEKENSENLESDETFENLLLKKIKKQ